MFTYFLIFAFANVAMFDFAHIRALKSDKRTFHEESVIEIEDGVEKDAICPALPCHSPWRTKVMRTLSARSHDGSMAV
ncbi:hypothetical protein [Aeromonas bivalvium]|uniref:hypothetical protein n=1 Tax=Aeromonas TaxID=642 RepID=UPI0038D0ABAF